MRAESVTAVVGRSRFRCSDELPRALDLDELRLPRPRCRDASGAAAGGRPCAASRRPPSARRRAPGRPRRRGESRTCGGPLSPRAGSPASRRERMPRHPERARPASRAASAATGPCRPAGRGCPRRGRAGVVANQRTSPYSCASTERRSGSSRARRIASRVTDERGGRELGQHVGGGGSPQARGGRAAARRSRPPCRPRRRRRSTRGPPRSLDGGGVSSKSSTSSAGLLGSARVWSASRSPSRWAEGTKWSAKPA